MPRWEQTGRFVTLVARNATLLVVEGRVGTAGTSSLERQESQEIAEAKLAAKAHALEAAGWTRSGRVIAPQAEPAPVAVLAAEAMRRFDELCREAGFDEENPTLDEAAAVLRRFASVRIKRATTQWAFEVSIRDERVFVSLRREVFDEDGEEHVAMLDLSYDADDELRADAGGLVQVEEPWPVFLAEMKDTPGYAALRTRAPTTFSYDSY